jgi:tetratricopeptide (TPR) repeat protein
MKMPNAILLYGLLLGLLLGCAREERHIMKGVESPQDREAYQRALADNPNDASALRGLGWLYLRENRTRAAADIFRKLLALTPDDQDVLYLSGVALSKEHRKTEASADFEKALELAPGFVEVRWALALLYNERGDGYEEALAMVQTGLRQAPDSGYGHFVLGFILCSRGENKPAEAALLKAVAIDPALAHAHYYLALVYLRLRDDERAMAAMERTIAAEPGYTEAYYSLGTLYARTGRVEDGERMIELFQQLSRSTMDEDHYRRLLYRQQDPVAPAKRAGSHFNLGLVYLRRGELDPAFRQFSEAMALDSTYAEASHNIGVVHSLNGRHREAQPYFERAIRAKPDYAMAYKNLGLSNLAQGHYQDAAGAFTRAIELNADMAEAHRGLATALIQQGEVAAGKTAMARAEALTGAK